MGIFAWNYFGIIYNDKQIIVTYEHMTKTLTHTICSAIIMYKYNILNGGKNK